MTCMPDEPIYQAARFNVVRTKYRAEDGREISREVIRHPGAVVILPMLDDGRVCLIRNFRPAVNAWLIEIPAGTLEPPIPVLDMAHRELKEETGYRAAKMELLAQFYVSPGILDEKMHLYVATGLTAGEPEREEQELIENLIVPFEEALAMVDRGEIVDAKTIVGLMLWKGRLGNGD